MSEMSDWRPPKGFLKGINIRFFLDDYCEWHAFVHGLCETLCPWPPQHKELSEILTKEIREDYHYYVFGRTVGMMTWIGIVVGIYFMVQ